MLPEVTERPPTTRRAAAHGRSTWNAVVVLGVTVVVLLLAWQRRWVSDDGLIVTRTVRQVLAGNGPVFNVGERVEANTSTAWTYLLVVAGLVTDVDLVRLSVGVGLALTVLAVALAADATRRLHAGSRGAHRMYPLGALVLVGLPPFWDFATSGLETGLVFAWLAGSWWCLVVLRRAGGAVRAPAGPATAVAVLLGTGPLVRPELAVAAAVFLLVLWWHQGGGVRTAVRLACVAAVLPLGYQVFRMGYYGMLVPQTAVAKSAASSLWQRGAEYAADLLGTYALLLPLLVVAVALVGVVAGRSAVDRAGTRLLVAAPVLVSAVLVVYVVRVGGDFMHARMLLPPLFLLVMPVLLVPASRAAAIGVVGTLVWTVVSAVTLRPDYLELERPVDPTSGVADERAFWTGLVGEDNPVTAAPFVRAFGPLAQEVDAVRPEGVVWRGRAASLPVREDLPWSVAVVMSIDGVGGNITSLDEAVVDPLGLTYPLAAHVELGEPGRPGHEKFLPDSYLAADVLPEGAESFPGGPSPDQVEAARRVLGCGAVAEMQAAVRQPLDGGRFVDNLTGAVERTSFTIPRDPVDAVAKFC